MHAVTRDSTVGRARLGFADAREADEFVATLRRFEAGEIAPEEWRQFRLVRGSYGQRQGGELSMLRAKVPQGLLSAEQLEAVAEVAQRFARGFAHLTTRQNFQFHFVALAEVEPALRVLNQAGLTTREACGNSVRNVTACPYAGVAADEAFDVTPYAEALTRHLLRHPLSSSLPRKFKIAFEGCPGDHVFAAINDIAWRAVRRAGPSGEEPGFRVGVGGGTSTLATSAGLLFEFLPAGEVLAVAEAIVRVFHRLGDRQHRQRNRLKFLIRQMGFPAWRAELERELAAVRAAGAPRLPFHPDHPPSEGPPPRRAPAPLVQDLALLASQAALRGPGLRPRTWPLLAVSGPEFLRWSRSNARAQKQDGYALATVTVPLGDLTAPQLRGLAALARSYGDGTLRATVQQNLLFRWVPTGALRALHAGLSALGLGLDGADGVADVGSCPGAESCRLAVTHSRGLARLLGDHLRERPELAEALAGADVKVSGCPNGCGQHHVAAIGLQGSLRKTAQGPVPQYFLSLGGGSDERGARFSRLVAKLPARRVPAALERLAALYARERRAGESVAGCFARLPPQQARETLADLEALEPGPADLADLEGESGSA